MRNKKLLIALCFGFLLNIFSLQAQQETTDEQLSEQMKELLRKHKPDKRIDNMRYWRRMVKLGLVKAAPDRVVPKAVYSTSKISAKCVLTEDSPDIPVTNLTNNTQSENSIFINPTDIQNFLNSNNSTSFPVDGVYGANEFYTFDGGANWGGEVEGAGGENNGDPSVVISNTGRYYIGFIHSNGGQGVSYSSNNGLNWTSVIAANPPSTWDILDKNHLWIDNSLTSSHEGNLYNAWTPFAGAHNSEIEFVRSTDQGLTWSAAIEISSEVNAGSHNQGVNLTTGPNGEVYAIWSVYDSNSNLTENAIGFAKSTDGGATFAASRRIISNLKGIRAQGTSKNMRVNSFPVISADISNSPYSGNLYVVFSNYGIPGINTGSDINVYMMKSTDGGESWETPMKINQDLPGLGNEHYFPWIACDPVYGYLSIIYYDDRNVSDNQAEVYVASSIDGGETWEEFKVSDVAFTPTPITGLADGYFGDYLAIAIHDRVVVPCWTDNRTGRAMTYVSPFELGPVPNQPYVVFGNFEINDQNGNNNQLAEYGENISISLTLRNIGDLSAANNITAKISCDSPYVIINDSTEQYPSIESGSEFFIENAFNFDLSDNVPNLEKIKFNLETTDGDSIWHSNFTVNANAPFFEIEKIEIDDSQANNNHIIDANETFNLKVNINNKGVSANNVNVSVFTSNQNVTIAENQMFIETFDANSLQTINFSVTTSNDIVEGEVVDFIIDALGGKYHACKIFYKQAILNVMETFESGDFTAFDWQLSGNQDWSVVSENPYAEAFCAKSGAISDEQNSVLEITTTLNFSGNMSFYRKVSSETGYDFLKFYIDNVQKAEFSGDLEWEKVTYQVTQGSHTFKWVYSKDYSVGSGSDCAWLDNIAFIDQAANPLTVKIVAQENSLCEGSTTRLYAVVYGGSGETEIKWDEAAGISDINSLSPIVSPSEENSTYTLRAKQGNNEVSAVININLSASPAVDLGDDLSLPRTAPYTLDAGEGFASYLWHDGSTAQTFTINPELYSEVDEIICWVEVTNESCTKRDSLTVAFWHVGIEEVNGFARVQLIPNPSNGKFQIIVSELKSKQIEIAIRNLQGQIIEHEVFNTTEKLFAKNFNFEKLQKGVYLVEVKTDGKTKVLKMIIAD